MKVWVVTITKFRDDYKVRGNCSSNEQPKIFTSQEKAKNYVANFLVDYVNAKAKEIEFEYFEDMINNVQLYTMEKFYNKKENNWLDSYPVLIPELREDYDVMIELVHPFIEGEYVPCKLSWSIDSVVIE